jgi:hypothetical protein
LQRRMTVVSRFPGCRILRVRNSRPHRFVKPEHPLAIRRRQKASRSSM